MIKVIGRARLSYAEIILHDGADSCRVGGEAYTDHSRTSVVCKAHRAEYQKWSKAQREQAKIKNSMP